MCRDELNSTFNNIMKSLQVLVNKFEIKNMNLVRFSNYLACLASNANVHFSNYMQMCVCVFPRR